MPPTWVRGRHNFKFGGEWLHMHFRQIFPAPPTMTFNATRSGNEVCGFPVGRVLQFSGGFGVTHQRQSAGGAQPLLAGRVQGYATLHTDLRGALGALLSVDDRYDRLSSLGGNHGQRRSPRGSPMRLQAFCSPAIRACRAVISPNRWQYFAPRLGIRLGCLWRRKDQPARQLRNLL